MHAAVHLPPAVARRGGRAPPAGLLAGPLLALLMTLAGLAMAGPVERASARPADVEAVVTRVVDGDTVWVRRVDEPTSAPRKVRLQGIDAPERCQPGGDEARRALAQRVLGQPVVLRPVGQDDHGRLLARLAHRGDDIGGWLVADGRAWSDGRGSSLGPYAAQQRRAREAGLGVHAQPGAMRPREFRRRFGACDPPVGVWPTAR